jgi:Uma2 family endonuclease
MAMATAAGALGPYTRADLEHTPDDGRRYELIDGYLYVSAAPGLVHQKAVMSLLVALHAACPVDFQVLPGPFAVPLAERTEVQPDVIVGRRTDFTEREIVTPALVVEVLSPSTRMFDTHVKRERLEQAGIPSYWIIDPVARPAEASLVVWELTEEGAYRQIAKAVGDEAFEAERPFPVTVVPADLVR